ncbi:MAG TPA: hypothetical protein VFQ05_02645 [Candidatus Eisenbacteria bacterium]|nr:hypothetical protein [Candidatus Eisenbacteria bacterium]
MRARSGIRLLLALQAAWWSGVLLVDEPFHPFESAHAATVGPDADSLYRRALGHLARPSPEHRRLALKDLEAAARRADHRTDILHAVAWTYSGMGYPGRARACLNQISRLSADDGEAQLHLGLLWKWSWLASLSSSDYAQSLRSLLRAAALAPRDLECRLALTALALAKGNVRLGVQAAKSAILCDRTAPEAALALGTASYFAGDLVRADSAFRAAVPRLPAEIRGRFTDLTGIAFDASLAQLSRAEAEADAFWRDRDPDLTTPHHEARLDFLARVAHAVLLLRDRRGSTWDMRAELFARYGIPKKVELPPPPGEGEDVFSYLTFFPFKEVGIGFPYHQQTWVYPDLGLRVELWDRSLRESYGLSVSEFEDADPRPSLDILAERADLVALEGGVGVYRSLPPGSTPMSVRAILAQFPSDTGARLLGYVEADGGPADTLRGSWAVVGADGRVVARNGGLLAVSACDPGARKVVQFDAVVPPGTYRVHLAVDGPQGRRGIARLESHVEPPSAQLALSELVPICEASVERLPGEPIRLDPDFERRVRGPRGLSVYFEVDHLSVDQNGRSRFAYAYVVRRADTKRGSGRKDADFEAWREEENAGPHRRQFVSGFVTSLQPGAYDFEIVVRDLRSGAVARRSIRFFKA